MNDRLLKESDVIKAIDKRVEELLGDSEFVRKKGYIDVLGIKRHILAIQSADRPQKWISCSEKLPEEEGMYLISVKRHAFDGDYHNVEIAYLSPNYKWIVAGSCEVLAWMPRPEPWSGNSTLSIDIVHCNECKHQKDCEKILVLSSMYGEIEDCANLDFCSYGIRKGVEDD